MSWPTALEVLFAARVVVGLSWAAVCGRGLCELEEEGRRKTAL